MGRETERIFLKFEKYPHLATRLAETTLKADEAQRNCKAKLFLALAGRRYQLLIVTDGCYLLK